MAGRRLIVCFDGTWNSPDQGGNVTNVVKMLRAITPVGGGVSQITFYDRGVGTGGPLDSIAGGASGKGLTLNMIDGYRFLANNFQEEDEIYVFGFSRGAYTARSLVGFIGMAGMLSSHGLGKQLDRALAIYRDDKLNTVQKRDAVRALDQEYGHARVNDVRIRCVGVWDTVGSLGIPGDLGRRLVKKYHFHDVQLSDKVDVALHAVAIDEKRSAFAPTLWVRKKGEAAPSGQIVEQVWFPGVHSNVGGSYPDATLSDMTLDWMIKRVDELTDLEFDRQYLKEHVVVRDDSFRGRSVESRTTMYASSRLFPYQRLINQSVPGGGGFGNWFRKKFKDLDRRNIPPQDTETINEMIHVCALERWDKEVEWDAPPEGKCKARAYRPVNLEALIRAHYAGKSIPVVGYDGRIVSDDVALWPEVDAPDAQLDLEDPQQA